MKRVLTQVIECFNLANANVVFYLLSVYLLGTMAIIGKTLQTIDNNTTNIILVGFEALHREVDSLNAKLVLRSLRWDQVKE